MTVGADLFARSTPQWCRELLDGDRRARGLELGLGLLGGILGDLLEQRLGSAVDEVLGLLEAQAGDDLADDLDDADLLLTGGLEDDVELATAPRRPRRRPAAAAPGAAATATGAAAVTSKVSSNALTNSESSSSVSSLNASSSSSVDSLAMMWSFLIFFGASGELRRLLRSFLSGLLLLQCGDQTGDLRCGSVEQAGGLGQVALHRAGQLGQQHLARLQVGDPLDLGDRQRAAVHVAALDDERLVVLGEGLDRLGGVDRLALDERDRGRDRRTARRDPRCRPPMRPA